MTVALDILREAGVGAFFRPRDVAPLGISHRRLQNLVASGSVENVGDGLYRLSEVEPPELETLAMVAAAVPNAIMCLVTALHFHDIGTPVAVRGLIALDRKARNRRVLPPRIRVVRFSGAGLTYGVVRHRALGVPFFMTSPARTSLIASAIGTSSVWTSPWRRYTVSCARG